MKRWLFAAALPLLFAGGAAAAQTGEGRRVVIAGAGPRFVPSYPGADGVRLAPLIFARVRRPGEPIPARSPDQSFSVRLIGEADGLSAGPVLGFEGEREDRDVGVPVGDVGFSVEPGLFVQGFVTPAIRIRAEARHGVTGHRGLVGDLAADFVLRAPDDALVATIGPRVRFSDGRFQRSYFGVREDRAGPSGLAAFRPDGGIHAAGLAGGVLYRLSPRWSVYAEAGYDRLVGDAADSPIVRAFGSRNQFSGGVAIAYQFEVDWPF